MWCCELPKEADYPGIDVDAIVDAAETAAAETLNYLTAQQFGLCTVALRPCRRDCWGGTWPRGWAEWAPGGAWPQPALIGGSWFNLTCGGCPDNCSCTSLSEALLPGPVHDITQVRVDGEILTEGVDWRLDNRRRLLRLGDTWPVCQHLELPATEPGTWEVTAQLGQPLPTLGQIALGELACAYVKACLPGDDCPLPQPVQQLVRQGITMTFLDPNEVFANGRVGLTRVDLFITSVNPHRLTARPRVYDPDALATPRWAGG